MADTTKLEAFYNALSESQKQKVESKLKVMLRESYESLPPPSVNLIRFQVASDLYQILKD